jgi:glutamate 5-kinase
MMQKKQYRRIIVKIGSNVITGSDGFVDLKRISQLSDQIAELKSRGVEVIVVSSGAVAAGRTLVDIGDHKHDMVAERQVFAAVGQVKLINTYNEYFKPHGIQCAQVLVTKEDFRDRLHYLNMRNCFSALLQSNIVPVVNENDVISFTELMFTDNDELAGHIAGMMDADAVVLLTNVDGLYDGNPADPEATIIPLVHKNINFSSFVSPEKSSFGRGGMVTKSKMALKLAFTGIAVHIANGKYDNILLDIIEHKPVGTFFIPHHSASTVKRWIAYSEGYAKGIIRVNKGAKDVLMNTDRASSLLPVGILKVSGTFERGDVIKILDEASNFIGLGVAQYSSEKARELLGKKNQKPLIHYDYLYVNNE